MFEDTIIRDHAIFRLLLKAMSRPGTVWQMPRERRGMRPDELLGETLRCLMDNEVTCHVADDRPEALCDAICRATGSRPAGLGAADFVVFPAGTSRGSLAGVKRGTLEYPDQGATVVYLVEELGETGGIAELQGPGIEDRLRPLIRGLDAAETGLLREANAEFPLGVDALFMDRDGRIMCIPRSTRIGVD
jgi:alpha-D-ribose 1-methylphosphonate 5-triphosphate synthase subunit PhnH